MITGKGVLNNRISEYLMTRLGEIGVPTHFMRRLNMREQLVREVEIIPLEVVVRNVAAGSLSERFGIAEGTALPRSIVEYYYKNGRARQSHGDARSTSPPSPGRRRRISTRSCRSSLRINDFLSGLFLGVGIRLVDLKVEFGRLWNGDDMRIVLADEISPTAAASGTSRRTRSSTRTASGAISARSPRPTRRWRGASASCPRQAPPISRARPSCSERHAS